MKIIKLLFLIIFYFTATNCFAQKELDFFNYWQYYSDNENALYKHFSKIAFDQLEDRRLEVGQLKAKEDWLEIFENAGIEVVKMEDKLNFRLVQFILKF